MTLLQTLACIPAAAEALATNRINEHLCLGVMALYGAGDNWEAVYCMVLQLMTALLHTLRYNFLQETLDFIGVHQDHMLQVCIMTALKLISVAKIL